MENDTDPYRFSIVIPAYNEAGYLESALKSLHQQDFASPYEVIVVDNNSTDDTAAIAYRHGARVLHEPQPGVCAARQRGTMDARGEIVVSTDADTVHPFDWLTRLDARFREDAGVTAVAGPCRYQDPPWWAAIFPRLWFAAVAVGYAAIGRVFYVTATNIAFVRTGFAGYDTNLTQGGDEVDLLRRLKRQGRIVWDANNAVVTSSRRMNQGLIYTLVVSFGYYYGWSYLLSRLSSRTIVGVAPAIRREHAEQVRRRQQRWRRGATVVALGLAAVLRVRSAGALPRSQRL